MAGVVREMRRFKYPPSIVTVAMASALVFLFTVVSAVRGKFHVEISGLPIDWPLMTPRANHEKMQFLPMYETVP